MDEITKRVNDTQEKIAEAINTSGLHPMIAKLILENALSQVNAILATGGIENVGTTDTEVSN